MVKKAGKIYQKEFNLIIQFIDEREISINSANNRVYSRTSKDKGWPFHGRLNCSKSTFIHSEGYLIYHQQQSYTYYQYGVKKNT